MRTRGILTSFVTSVVSCMRSVTCAMRVSNNVQAREHEHKQILSFVEGELSSEQKAHDVDRVESYDWGLSTADNYGLSTPVDFVGPFAEIRKMRDYSSHQYYPKFRQQTQDAIINHFLGDIDSPLPDPTWIVYTAGAMGAGKGYTVRRLIEHGVFLSGSFVYNCMDKIRSMLPENDEYVKRDPETAGYMTQKEAGYISELLTEAALIHGRHIVVDGSLQSRWWATEIERVKTLHPARLLAILHVTAPLEDVKANVAMRARLTGRVVPEADILQSFHAVPKNVNMLSHLPYVDACYELRNVMGVQMPGLKTCEGVELAKVNARFEDDEWKFFKRRWTTDLRKKVGNHSLGHADEHCEESYPRCRRSWHRMLWTVAYWKRLLGFRSPRSCICAQ